MCRLFGLLGTAATPPEPWLVGTERSLLAQSNHSEETAQRDGWGIAWYSNRRSPKVEKGVGGAFEAGEVDRFRSAARGAKGPVVIGHLRHASNPMRLSHERLIGLENSQPFVHGGAVFAHNGSIPLPRETRPLLGEFEPMVKGVNDSEVLFWLIVRHLEASGDPLGAYAESVRELEEVWQKAGRPGSNPFTGLNVLFTRGPNELWAFCRWNGDHGPSFFDESRPYYQIAYRADAKTVLVGSEPLDGEPSAWRSLGNGEFLHAQLAHGLVAVETGPIPVLAPAPVAASTPVSG